MALIDEQVKEWLKGKFLQSAKYYPETQGGPEDIEIVSAEAGWECCCYSEWTRDDEFQMTAIIKGSNGREFRWVYGAWGSIPEFIEELDEYVKGVTCRYNEGGVM